MEILNRHRLNALMDRQDIDALIVAARENVLYLSGVYSLGQWLMNDVMAFAIVARDEAIPTSVVLPISDVDLVAERPPANTAIFPYGKFFVEPSRPNADVDAVTERLRQYVERPPATGPEEALRAAMASLPKAVRTIGVDVGQSETASMLNAIVGADRAKDVRGLTLRARQVKTDAEVERLRGAAHLTEDAMMRVIDELVEGMTEAEARRILEETIVSRGGVPALTVIGFGPHSAFPNATPGARRLQRGDVVRFDVGCRYQHYFSDLSRCAVFGEPTKRILQYYDALLYGEDVAISAAKPGVEAQAVFDAAVNAVKDRAIPHYRRQHVGHGIGLEVYDPPVLRAGNNTVLEEGMVLNVETPYYEAGFAGLQIEDLVRITADGCEILTKTERKLYIRDA